jgi:hypothetical protein
MVFHRAERDSIPFNLIGGRPVLMVIFDEQATAGMVHLYAFERNRKLPFIFDEDARERLDSLFS